MSSVNPPVSADGEFVFPTLKEARNIQFIKFSTNNAGDEVAIFKKSGRSNADSEIRFTRPQLQEYASAVKGSRSVAKGKTLEFDERYYKHLERVLIEWVMGK